MGSECDNLRLYGIRLEFCGIAEQRALQLQCLKDPAFCFALNRRGRTSLHVSTFIHTCTHALLLAIVPHVLLSARIVPHVSTLFVVGSTRGPLHTLPVATWWKQCMLLQHSFPE